MACLFLIYFCELDYTLSINPLWFQKLKLQGFFILKNSVIFADYLQ